MAADYFGRNSCLLSVVPFLKPRHLRRLPSLKTLLVVLITIFVFLSTIFGSILAKKTEAVLSKLPSNKLRPVIERFTANSLTLPAVVDIPDSFETIKESLKSDAGIWKKRVLSDPIISSSKMVWTYESDQLDSGDVGEFIYSAMQDVVDLQASEVDAKHPSIQFFVNNAESLGDYYGKFMNERISQESSVFRSYSSLSLWLLVVPLIVLGFVVVIRLFLDVRFHRL